MMGFRGFFYNFLHSYLSDRHQSVRINQSVSHAVPINYGVPQGSVLGPLLFLVYINSIFHQQLSASTVCFADDMVFLYKGQTISDIEFNTTRDLEKLKVWFDAHYLFMSDKSKFMSFHLSDSRKVNLSPIVHSTNCNNSNCNLICLKIEQVSEYKYLGILFDSNLTWRNHVMDLKNYSLLVIRKLFLLKNLCSSDMLRTIYLALGSSKLQYGLTAWGSCYYNVLKPLITIQKFMLRIIHGANRLQHSWPLFVGSKILPLRHLFIYKVLRIFYDRSGNRNLRILSAYNIRSNNSLYVNIPRFNTTIFRRSFTVIAPKMFNMLPRSLVIIQTRKKFLLELKTWLFSMDTVEFVFNDIV